MSENLAVLLSRVEFNRRPEATTTGILVQNINPEGARPGSMQVVRFVDTAVPGASGSTS